MHVQQEKNAFGRCTYQIRQSTICHRYWNAVLVSTNMSYMWSQDLRVGESARFSIPDLCHDNCFFALEMIQNLAIRDVDGIVVAWPAHVKSMCEIKRVSVLESLWKKSSYLIMSSGLMYPEKNRRAAVPFTPAHTGMGKHLVLYQMAVFASDEAEAKAAIEWRCWNVQNTLFRSVWITHCEISAKSLKSMLDAHKVPAPAAPNAKRFINSEDAMLF